MKKIHTMFYIGNVIILQWLRTLCQAGLTSLLDGQTEIKPENLRMSSSKYSPLISSAPRGSPSHWISVWLQSSRHWHRLRTSVSTSKDAESRHKIHINTVTKHQLLEWKHWMVTSSPDPKKPAVFLMDTRTA